MGNGNGAIPVTPQEDAALAQAVDLVRQYQQSLPKPTPFLADDGFAVLGYTPEQIAAAKAAGFSRQVHVFNGKGWVTHVYLDRNAHRYRRAFVFGPSLDWFRTREIRSPGSGLVNANGDVEDADVVTVEYYDPGWVEVVNVQ